MRQLPRWLGLGGLLLLAIWLCSPSQSASPPTVQRAELAATESTPAEGRPADEHPQPATAPDPRSPLARSPESPSPTPGAPPRATTWVVLKVQPSAAEVVAVVHKDELPYAPRDTGPVRFRLIERDGNELRGPCAWPRLCPCAAQESHTTGCIRRHHTGSVRLRLPRLTGTSQLVIERRAGAGWTVLARVEVVA